MRRLESKDHSDERTDFPVRGGGVSVSAVRRWRRYRRRRAVHTAGVGCPRTWVMIRRNDAGRRWGRSCAGRSRSENNLQATTVGFRYLWASVCCGGLPGPRKTLAQPPPDADRQTRFQAADLLREDPE
jgi:hypothetical protein